MFMDVFQPYKVAKPKVFLNNNNNIQVTQRYNYSDAA